MGETKQSYEYWRVRIMYTTMFGYILFYFVRKNLSMAMPGIEEDLGITKTELGVFLTAHGLLYGLSKLCNGIFGDRVNPRYFMPLGLLLCAVANFGFGMSNVVWTMGLFWLLNAWFQGMGFPPCAKSLAHWYSPKERGITMSIWNTSHSLGAGLIFLLNAWTLWYFNDWRYCFFVPGLLAVIGSILLFERLRDTPESLGLEPIEEYQARRTGVPVEEKPMQNPEENPSTSVVAVFYRHVLANPLVWIVSIANFFVYVVRFAILDWAPTFLKESKGIEIYHAGILGSLFELLGVAGMLLSGFLMDRLFRGRGGRVCFLFMLGCTLTMGLFLWTDSDSVFVNAVFLGLLGFFIYGPQCLIGAMTINFATKKAASGAIGVNSVFGYLSVIVTGWGIGLVAEKYDWNVVFLCLIGFSVAATVLFLLVFNVTACEEESSDTETSGANLG